MIQRFENVLFLCFILYFDLPLASQNYKKSFLPASIDQSPLVWVWLTYFFSDIPAQPLPTHQFNLQQYIFLTAIQPPPDCTFCLNSNSAKAKLFLSLSFLFCLWFHVCICICICFRFFYRIALTCLPCLGQPHPPASVEVLFSPADPLRHCHNQSCYVQRRFQAVSFSANQTFCNKPLLDIFSLWVEVKGPAGEVRRTEEVWGDPSLWSPSSVWGACWPLSPGTCLTASKCVTNYVNTHTQVILSCRMGGFVFCV